MSVLTTFLFFRPEPAAAQGIGYAAVPGITYVKWHDALGLDDDYLYGGKFSFLLGPRIALQPYYFLRNNVTADPANAEDAGAFAGFAAREVDLRHFGADLQISMAEQGIVPFIRLGGGLMRMNPDGLERTENISLKAGGGIRLGGGNVRAEFFAEDWAFRLDRGALYVPASGTPPNDPESDDLRHNLVVGAGLNVALGGGVGDTEWNPGGTGLSIEPFVGQLRYNDDFNLGDQNVAGARAGIDFNSYFGVRGFYWQAVNDDFDRTQDLSSYGAEAQFSLGAGAGLAPYIVAGAGRFDYDSGYPTDSPQDDRTALILGGGISLGLGSNFQLKLAARNYLFDRSQQLEDVSDPDDLTSNLLYSAGLTFRVGGNPNPGFSGPSPVDMDEVEQLRRENERLREQGEVERLREQNEMLRQQQQSDDDNGELTAAERREEIRSVIRDELQGTGAMAGQTLPQAYPDREFDLLIRYFDERIELAVDRIAVERERDMLRRQRVLLQDTMLAPEDDGRDGLTESELDERLDRFEQNLADRIDRIIDQRMEEDTGREPEPDTVRIITERSAPETREQPVGREPAVQAGGQLSIREYRPYVGLNFNDPTQFVFGLRTDLGPITAGSMFRFVPEVAFGVGEENTTVLVGGNLQFDIATIGERYAFTPFVEAGGGIYSESVLTLNVGYGVAADVNVGGRDLRMFAEHQGLNVYDTSRLLVGLRLER